jgi:DNA-damage-inducible protein D
MSFVVRPLGTLRIWQLGGVNVIEKLMYAWRRSGQDVKKQFSGITKMVKLGAGAQRGIEDIMLTCYACYMIAQNGDPRKSKLHLCKLILLYK